MTIKEIATNTKFWIAIVAAVIGGAGALGATVDRPAWKSELVITQKLAMQNAKDIIQLDIDSTQRRIWDHEDRYEVAPNPDLERKIKELIKQIHRLEEELKSILKEEG